ncbi:MAG: MarR family transcriptional regulator [Pseudonocardiaceae bacterium]|nr:MarR family transcriptional regulator [Pseudonocardiaceae bacterium]
MHDSRLANLLGAAAVNVADRLTAAAASAAGASTSGTAALITLAGQPGIGVTELGARIGLSQPACARMLDQLTARGLVRRRQGSGRSVPVHLTRSGAAAARRALRERERELVALLDRLTPAQQDELAGILEPLLEGLFHQAGSQHVVCRLCDHAACIANDCACPVGQAARAE